MFSNYTVPRDTRWFENLEREIKPRGILSFSPRWNIHDSRKLGVEDPLHFRIETHCRALWPSSKSVEGRSRRNLRRIGIPRVCLLCGSTKTRLCYFAFARLYRGVLDCRRKETMFACEILKKITRRYRFYREDDTVHWVTINSISFLLWSKREREVER